MIISIYNIILLIMIIHEYYGFWILNEAKKILDYNGVG